MNALIHVCRTSHVTAIRPARASGFRTRFSGGSATLKSVSCASRASALCRIGSLLTISSHWPTSAVCTCGTNRQPRLSRNTTTSRTGFAPPCTPSTVTTAYRTPPSGPITRRSSATLAPHTSTFLKTSSGGRAGAGEEHGAEEPHDGSHASLPSERATSAQVTEHVGDVDGEADGRDGQPEPEEQRHGPGRRPEETDQHGPERSGERGNRHTEDAEALHDAGASGWIGRWQSRQLMSPLSIVGSTSACLSRKLRASPWQWRQFSMRYGSASVIGSVYRPVSKRQTWRMPASFPRNGLKIL